jgi:hypothetical protein
MISANLAEDGNKPDLKASEVQVAPASFLETQTLPPINPYHILSSELKLPDSPSNK